jgi:hypothetical protein
MIKRLKLRLTLLSYTLSCGLNVLFLRRPEDTSAGESTSGRTYWETYHGKSKDHWTWRLGLWFIDTTIFWDREDGKKHCELADIRDYERAKEKVRRFESRNE